MAIRRQKLCRLIAILSPRIEYTSSIGHIRRQKEKVSGDGNPLMSVLVGHSHGVGGAGAARAYPRPETPAATLAVP